MDHNIIIKERAAARARDKELEQHLRHYRLSVNQWLILGLLRDSDGMRTTEVARALDTSLAYVTSTTKVLVARGLVTKTTDRSDGRAVQIKYSGGDLLNKISNS